MPAWGKVKGERVSLHLLQQVPSSAECDRPVHSGLSGQFWEHKESPGDGVVRGASVRGAVGASEQVSLICCALEEEGLCRPRGIPSKRTQLDWGEMIFFFLQMRQVKLAQGMICPGSLGLQAASGSGTWPRTMRFRAAPGAAQNRNIYLPPGQPSLGHAAAQVPAFLGPAHPASPKHRPGALSARL